MADRETMDGIAGGLAAIDDTIRDTHKTGGPGTGIFFLLDNLAVALHATRRSQFPIAEKRDPAADLVTDRYPVDRPVPVPVPADPPPVYPPADPPAAQVESTDRE